MRLWNENREFLKKHHLTINKAIAILMAQERDANECGATLFPEKDRAINGKCKCEICGKEYEPQQLHEGLCAICEWQMQEESWEVQDAE